MAESPRTSTDELKTAAVSPLMSRIVKQVKKNVQEIADDTGNTGGASDKPGKRDKPGKKRNASDKDTK